MYRTQLKQTLKKKTFEDAGIPVKQVAIVSASQPSQPVAVAVQPQIQTIHKTHVPHILNIQPIQTVQPLQNLQQFQQIIPTTVQPQQQQFHFVQQVHQPPVPILAPISQPIEITEISTDDQTNDDSQDEDPNNVVMEETAPTAVAPFNDNDQSIDPINNVLIHSDGTEATDESGNAAKLELPDVVDSSDVIG